LLKPDGVPILENTCCDFGGALFEEFQRNGLLGDFGTLANLLSARVVELNPISMAAQPTPALSAFPHDFSPFAAISLRMISPKDAPVSALILSKIARVSASNVMTSRPPFASFASVSFLYDCLSVAPLGRFTFTIGGSLQTQKYSENHVMSSDII
jgi:hypothetical protein